ncbi:tail fiber domain-containing protein [Hwangdonia seohaensis]|uniref:Tail fiber domain-containing protein n=1 Tax=Hwangdonia seohaensis TaxID=1240727 RepID=A0ABW3R9Y3_9FLAO|nr:tail fiber domain-containing protein [Hwangdonia seohaensis]
MKNIPTILLALFITGLSFSQPTQSKGINYKALIKDNNNNALINQNITIEFSILEGPEIQFLDVVYAETHTTSTDANGIVIVNIGEGVPLTGYEDVYNQLDWRRLSVLGSRFLKVQVDSGSGLTDMGTTEFKMVPYALYAEQSNNTGLEQLDEGGGIGWRLIDRPEDFYGPIAIGAVDLSYSWSPSLTKGATGNYATAVGLNTTASGQSSFASGVGTIASQAQATAMGAGTVASGHSSTALGIGTRAEAPNSTAIGLYNVGGGDPLLAASTDPLFEIGNGQYIDGTNDIRRNALTVLRNGTITAPSFDINEITDAKALITKEYADANYSGGSGGASTGLEAIDEGNGSGWRLKGRDPANHGNIGRGAIDLSDGFAPSSEYGATGNYSFALGNRNIASNIFSFAGGFSSRAIGYTTFSYGYGTWADAYKSTAFGNRNLGGGDPDAWVDTDPLFEIGNGNDNFRSNALTILKNGTITAPTFDISEITDAKSLITKEYADANYSGGTGGATGLEAIDEGNGLGWRLINKDPNYYDNIGANAVDLSTNPDAALNLGASGSSTFTAGYKTYATNFAATAFGNFTTASGFSATSMGFETIADDQFSTVVGRLNDNTTATNILFQVGNGNSSGRSNAFTVNFDGVITAPSFDINEITNAKALITKEYADATYSGGLAALDEGNGIGYRISGRDPNNYGQIGLNAVDLSTSTTASFSAGALGSRAFAAGSGTEAIGNSSTALGFSTQATGAYSTALGSQSQANGAGSTAFGFSALASGDWSTAMGYNSEASGDYAFALGKDNSATKQGAVSIGTNTTASANFATALGANTMASGIVSTALGNLTTASGLYATAMGTNTNATGDFSTAMGVGTTAHGDYSFASGSSTIGNGSYSAAFGSNTDAYGDYSVAMGLGTIADGQSSLVIGEYNDIRPDVLFQIGNGTGDGTGGTFRANAMTVFTNGHILAFSYDLPSDRRLKSNIIDLNYGLQTILKLSPVAYNWKNRPEESSKTFGLIAQDVQPIINEIVDVGEDKNKTLSINYTELIPVLIKAIQDQQNIIDNQNKKINNLSAQVEQFKDLSYRIAQLESLNNNQQ